MSWKERTESQLTVTTGDKKQYKPISINHSKSFEFNITQFDFVDITGSLVKRKKRKARKFPIEWYFVGEDHLDTAREFELSSEDERRWIVDHPLYGRILCEPLDLSFDNTDHNITKVTGTILETIDEDNPKSVEEPVDKIIADKATVDEAFAATFANEVIPNTDDKGKLTENVNALYNEGVKSVKNNVDAEAYFNLFNTANAKITRATADPLSAINAVQAAINYPFLFADSVKNRLTVLVNQFNKLRQSIATITSRSGKKIYENNAASLISSMAATAATPQTSDYGNRNDVLNTITPINEAFDSYLTDLDALQNANGGSVDSYIPDPNSLILLNDLVNFTISNLFAIALGAKQERSILLEDDSNAIILTHRFYGLDQQDLNLNLFISQNNVGLNELLLIKKGRKIIYYV
jgi:hypothetical protein